jgi:hypothetical protein
MVRSKLFPERWQQFERMWREAVLEAFKISHFHSNQIAKPKGRFIAI